MKSNRISNIVPETGVAYQVTTMLDDSIPLTTTEWEEWGNPADPQYYDYMLQYSPMDNIRRAAYPNILITGDLSQLPPDSSL